MNNKDIIIGAVIGAVVLLPVAISFGFSFGFIILEALIGLVIGIVLALIRRKNKTVYTTSLVGGIIGLVVGITALNVNLLPLSAWLYYFFSAPVVGFSTLLAKIGITSSGDGLSETLGWVVSVPSIIITGVAYGILVGLVVNKYTRRNIEAM